MKTGDWILNTRYWILDAGYFLERTIAHEFDICGPPISDFGLQNADFMFWGDIIKGVDKYGHNPRIF